jgi:hypothetical protein
MKAVPSVPDAAPRTGAVAVPTYNGCMQRAELDHLVVAAARLADGIDWVEAQLGVRPQPGGQHVAMGTHNALVAIGPRSYLEVIAVDPDLPPPARPRWFGLDTPAVQQRLAAGPALLTWVVRCDSLAAACARVPELGDILPMQRSDYRWQIAVPATGELPSSGVLPAAIQWGAGDDGSARHPCDRLPASGVALRRLALTHPTAVLGTAGLVATFRELRIIGSVDLAPGPVALAAHFDTPAGTATLA